MRISIVFLLVFMSITTYPQVHVSDNQRFLATQDNKPFFWLGDTDWAMVHRLTREEIKALVDVRSEQGFNVLQIVALAEFGGIHSPNRQGDVPLNNDDPTQLSITPGSDPANPQEYDYWDHLDYAIKLCTDKGIYVGLLPTWGDKVAHLPGDGPLIFNEKNAEVYARIIATRYKDQKNMLWILGGDRPAVYKGRGADDAGKDYDDRPVWRAMAKGIEDVLGKQAFITYHPSGGKYRSSDYMHEETWLDMNAFQSGHGSRAEDAWTWVTEDLAKKPQKPTLDMEPCYEDHPVNPWDNKWTRARGYFNAYDVRTRIYRGIFAGACGVTYGHHSIWQFVNPSLYSTIWVGDTLITWQKAMHAEAAGEMQYLKNLMLSRPYFNRIPDQSIIKSDPGSTYVDLILATRDEAGTYAMLHLPQNKPVTVDLSKISGTTKKVWWYSPVTGKATAAPDIKGKANQSFTPPKEGNDWVLVIDDATKKFKAPGELLPH
jgi:hypothetical protein